MLSNKISSEILLLWVVCFWRRNSFYTTRHNLYWHWCLLHIRTLPSKAQAVAAAVNRPLPHYKLGDLGIVPRSHPKLGERPGASSPLAPISRQTRSVGVQTVSAQKVSAFITILPMIISYKLSTRFLNNQTPWSSPDCGELLLHCFKLLESTGDLQEAFALAK